MSDLSNQTETPSNRHKIPALTTVGLCAFWIGMTFASINDEIKPPKQGEKYGWSVPFVFAFVILPVAFFAYQWGRDDAN